MIWWTRPLNIHRLASPKTCEPVEAHVSTPIEPDRISRLRTARWLHVLAITTTAWCQNYTSSTSYQADARRWGFWTSTILSMEFVLSGDTTAHPQEHAVRLSFVLWICRKTVPQSAAAAINRGSKTHNDQLSSPTLKWARVKTCISVFYR